MAARSIIRLTPASQALAELKAAGASMRAGARDVNAAGKSTVTRMLDQMKDWSRGIAAAGGLGTARALAKLLSPGVLGAALALRKFAQSAEQDKGFARATEAVRNLFDSTVEGVLTSKAVQATLRYLAANADRIAGHIEEFGRSAADFAELIGPAAALVKKGMGYLEAGVRLAPMLVRRALAALLGVAVDVARAFVPRTPTAEVGSKLEAIVLTGEPGLHTVSVREIPELKAGPWEHTLAPGSIWVKENVEALEGIHRALLADVEAEAGIVRDIGMRLLGSPDSPPGERSVGGFFSELIAHLRALGIGRLHRDDGRPAAASAARAAALDGWARMVDRVKTWTSSEAAHEVAEPLQRLATTVEGSLAGMYRNVAESIKTLFKEFATELPAALKPVGEGMEAMTVAWASVTEQLEAIGRTNGALAKFLSSQRLVLMASVALALGAVQIAKGTAALAALLFPKAALHFASAALFGTAAGIAQAGVVGLIRPPEMPDRRRTKTRNRLPSRLNIDVSGSVYAPGFKEELFEAIRTQHEPARVRRPHAALPPGSDPRKVLVKAIAKEVGKAGAFHLLGESILHSKGTLSRSFLDFAGDFFGGFGGGFDDFFSHGFGGLF